MESPEEAVVARSSTAGLAIIDVAITSVVCCSPAFRKSPTLLVKAIGEGPALQSQPPRRQRCFAVSALIPWNAASSDS